jgi:hypothetical protein
MVNGQLKGHCLVGDDTVISPGAFKRMSGLKVPLRLGQDGPIIGEAEISNDGEVITAELTTGSIPGELRDMFLIGHADALSIDTCKVQAYPAPLTQEQKSQRWNQRTTPYGV